LVVDYDAKSPPYCAAPDGRRDYCGPEAFAAQPDRLYRNDGHGTFTEISRLAGIDQPEGRGLGVLIAELTGDNRPDIYVANDGTPCWPFANRGNLRFEDVTDQGGGWFQRPILGRGLAVGDLDGDHRPDVVVNALDVPSAVLRNTSVVGQILDVDIIDQAGQTAVGARVRITAGGRTRTALVVAGGSYLSSSPGRLQFGLASAPVPDQIEVEWPWE
jgi:enediyne biosynthesis protein E4